MKKIILLLTLASMLFVSCEEPVLNGNKFDCYFESGINPIEFQMDSGAETLFVKKTNSSVRLIRITEPNSENTTKDTVFEQDELANTVKSDFTEVTISSDQVKIVIKENDAAYDRKIRLFFTGLGTSKDAVMTMGIIVIIQKAKP